MKQTKAILVIDMPENCLDCPCVNPELWCQVSGKCIKTEYKPRPKRCPLRPLPQNWDMEEIERIINETD